MGKKEWKWNGAGNIALWWVEIPFSSIILTLSICLDDWISLLTPSFTAIWLILILFYFSAVAFYIPFRVGSWNPLSTF